MALGNKRTPRKLVKGRTDGLLDSSKETKASASMADDVFSQDAAYVDSNLTPIMYHADLIQEDVDELRRYVTNDISSGGGLTESPLAMMSGRWQWGSADERERIHVGHASYGPFNYYVFSQEPSAVKGNTTFLRYNTSHAVNTTTAPMMPYFAAMMGVWSPNNGKKIKMKASGRFQGANSGATFGISLWDTPEPSNGATSNTAHTATLRGLSNSITVDTTSTKYWSMELTTTNAINGRWALPMLENRTGNWTSNVYFYGQIALYLVD